MNYLKNLKYTQKYLKNNSIDTLLVTSDYKYLKDGDITENPRYLLSGFNGTAATLLIKQDCAYIFVDGRYHIQVDEQIDKKFITPVKLSMEMKLVDEIYKRTDKNSKMAIDYTRISSSFFENLEKKLNKKNVKIVDIGTDFLQSFVKEKKKRVYKIRKSGINIIHSDIVKRLKGLLSDENVYLSVFSNDEICYLTNLRANQFSCSSSFNCFGFINKTKTYLFCDLAIISKEIKNSLSNVEFFDFSELQNFIEKLCGKVLIYNSDCCPCAFVRDFLAAGIILKKIKINPISNLKAQKSNEELEVIKMAHKKASVVVLNTINYINANINKQNLTLKDFINKLKYEAKKVKYVDFSFNTILALNEKTAVVHNTNFDINEKINEGDLILLDFGLYFQDGFATDMTRTFCVGNKCNNKEYKKVYTTVLRAFLSTLNLRINQSTTYFDFDQKARRIINKSKLQGYNFNHSTGHGIGLNVHEYPPILSMSKKSMQKLKPNHVFSIEPGMYKKGVCGVRIEDSVYTQRTKDGIKIFSLTNLPFDENLIVWDMLTEQEKKYYHNYMKRILS